MEAIQAQMCHSLEDEFDEVMELRTNKKHVFLILCGQWTL